MICIQLCYPSLFRNPGKIMSHWQAHKSWWSVTDMPGHPFHTPVCWNCRMPGGERMAPAMKSLTMHCMSPYRCFKKPAVHFGTNKFMSSADRMELEYGQLFLHCLAPFQTKILCPSGANLVAESKRLEPQNHSHDKQCLDVPPAQLLCFHKTGEGFPCDTYQLHPELSCLQLAGWLLCQIPSFRSHLWQHFPSLTVHAVMNDTRQAESPKSASIPEARRSKKRRRPTAPSIDLWVVVGTGIMYFLLLLSCSLSC